MTQLAFPSSYVHLNFVLTRTVETLQKMSPPVFISLLMNAHSPDVLLVGREGLKGGGTVVLLLSLSFCIVLFSVNSHLIQGSHTKEQDVIECLDHSCFSEHN